MRIRKNFSRLIRPFYSDGPHQTLPSCQPVWSVPTHNAHDVVQKGDEVTTNKICNPTPASERICGLNQQASMADKYDDYLDCIPCRDEFMCNYVALKKLDEELKMDCILEKCTSNKREVVKKMKQDIFLEKKIDGDGKMMCKAAERSSSGKKCKKKMIPTVMTQRTTLTSSKLDEVKDLVSGVVMSASVSTSSNPRKRKNVAYGSGQDYFYYT